jgi:hypothetical protein
MERYNLCSSCFSKQQGLNDGRNLLRKFIIIDFALLGPFICHAESRVISINNNSPSNRRLKFAVNTMNWELLVWNIR